MLDASVALSWVLPDEDAEAALALRQRAIRAAPPLSVPPTFWFEVANALSVSIRRGRIAASGAHAALEALQAFGIETSACAVPACLAVAEGTGLAVYDAAYIVTALDVGGVLGTADVQMREIAHAVGLEVLP